MATTHLSSMRETVTRYDTPESTHSNMTAEAASSNGEFPSSTPPTSVADSTGISFATEKLDAPVLSIFDREPIVSDESAVEEPEPSNGRPRRARKSILGTCNPTELSGAASAAKRARKAEKECDEETLTRRRTVSANTLVGSLDGNTNESKETIVKEASKLVDDGIEALDLPWSAKALSKSRSAMSLGTSASLSKEKNGAEMEEVSRRRSTRFTDEPVENLTKKSLTKKLNVVGKRGRGAMDEASAKIKRELMRLADTNEFAKIEMQPVIHEVWSRGKLVTGSELPKKRTKVEILEEKAKEPELEVVVEEKPRIKRQKKWLNKGLYAGQEAFVDLSAGYTAKERKAMAKANSNIKKRSILPLPLWAGQRLLLNGRDFKLPFDVCCPLPPGQPKPDEWKKTTKNRFVGDAAALWKKSKHFGDFDSRCICSKDTGCGETCYNRMMLYECDDKNCSISREFCNNRAFADLQERRSKGGKYRVGVEVIKTEDCGYGVRANRCFNEGQIIVEYTGEIITEPECQRRMKEDYKDNDCYYLMLFDQNMIIDATRGSIARFVNHSCEPNCEMVKWIVGGKPRMALFAGKNPIMTGEELTYDYNFDPFSSQNIQECRCGSKNCRGVLGPKPKESKTAKSLTEGVAKAVKGAVNASKRKLKELLGGDTYETEKTDVKKRKVAVLVSKSAPAKALDAAKSVARRVSMSVTAGTKRGSILPNTPKNVKTYVSGKGLKQAKLSSRNSSLTIVAHNDSELSPKEDDSNGDNSRELTEEERDAAYEAALKRLESGSAAKSRRANVVMSMKKRTTKGMAKKTSIPKLGRPKKIIRVIHAAGEEAE